MQLLPKLTHMHIFCSNASIFLLTLDTIDILCLVYSNFWVNKINFIIYFYKKNLFLLK